MIATLPHDDPSSLATALQRLARLAAHAAGAKGAVVRFEADLSAAGTAGEVGLALCATVPLVGSKGRILGSLEVFDQPGAADLTGAQWAALADVAGLAAAAHEGASRHARLMEVTGRARRADAMLRLVSDAQSCADALTSLLGDLCRYHKAAVGRIWRLMPDEMMQEVSRFNDRSVEHPYYTLPPSRPVRPGSSMTAEAIAANEPRWSIYAHVPDKDRFALLGAAIEAGLASQVSYPIWVQDQRFGVALAFVTERADLDDVVEDIASLANTIRPALFRKVTEEQIRFLAHHDELTQLSNRAMFNLRLQEEMESSQKGGLALLYLDLDGFKRVNDTRGHEVGDHLLAAVAGRLRATVRDVDTVARIGGDEFAILQTAAGQPYPATQLARRLLQAIAQPFDIDGKPCTIGVSIGIALHPVDGDTADVLQRNADAALYEAKQTGRNGVRLFSASLGALHRERVFIEQDLRVAIQEERFTLAYQPIVETGSLGVRGFEALLRWTHPVRGPIAPGVFVPVAESSGLIVPLGRWALLEACRVAAGWKRHVCLSVNFSPLQFKQAGLVQQIESVLATAGLPASRLDLEVTEGLLLDDSKAALQTMHDLKALGVQLTLDDFGTAYASLSSLRRYPFDRIKIDKSFIQAMCDDDSTLAIVEGVLALSRRLHLQVVAEGVETERELETLRRLDCRLVQGFFTGRPMPAEQAAVLAVASSG